MKPIYNLPIYVAGGYADKAVAGAVAEILESVAHVRVTFPWWHAVQVTENDERMCARSELLGLRDARTLIVLDKYAGIGTATESGYFMRDMLNGERPLQLLHIVHAEHPVVLDWFLGAMRGQGVRRVEVGRWDPDAIADAVISHSMWNLRDENAQG